MIALATSSPLLLACSAFFGGFAFALAYLFISRAARYASLTYPVASGKIPVIGAAIKFGMDGLNFLREEKERLKSNVFLVDLLIMRFHFVLGPENTKLFYKAPNEVEGWMADVDAAPTNSF